MATFENPNNPVQPQKGVYAWYATKGNQRRAIYIGEAGKRTSLIQKGTLFRGVSELQQNTFSSNSPKYNILDTDFIVGAAIRYFEGHGYECIWKHISNNPKEEIDYILEEKPILQNIDNTNIKKEFKAKRLIARYWQLNRALDKEAKISEAAHEICEALRKYGI